VSIALAGLWAAIQILAGCGSLPDELRAQLVVWKNILGILFFVVTALACPTAWRPTGLGLLAGLFPLYAAFRLWSRGVFDDPLIVLFIAWWWGFFVVVPTAFRPRKRYRLLVASVVGASIAATVLGMLLGVVEDQIYWWDHERMVFSFTNPIYFAYGGLIIAVGAFFLVDPSRGRHRNAVWWTVLVFGLAIVIGARARNAMLFLAAATVSYWITGRRHQLVFAALIGLMLFAIALPLGAGLADRLDELSSGRVSLWSAVIDENVGTVSVAEVLFGVGEFEQSILVSHDDVAASARFVRAHSDNAYLDLFLSLGLVGLLLFIGPLLWVARQLILLRDVGLCPAREVRIAVATLAGFLVQGVVVSNVPSLGNVVNVLCMSLVMAVWGNVNLAAKARMRVRAETVSGTRAPTRRPSGLPWNSDRAIPA